MLAQHCEAPRLASILVVPSLCPSDIKRASPRAAGTMKTTATRSYWHSGVPKPWNHTGPRQQCGPRVAVESSGDSRHTTAFDPTSSTAVSGAPCWRARVAPASCLAVRVGVPAHTHRLVGTIPWEAVGITLPLRRAPRESFWQECSCGKQQLGPAVRAWSGAASMARQVAERPSRWSDGQIGDALRTFRVRPVQSSWLRSGCSGVQGGRDG